MGLLSEGTDGHSIAGRWSCGLKLEELKLMFIEIGGILQEPHLERGFLPSPLSPPPFFSKELKMRNFKALIQNGQHTGYHGST